MRDLYKRTFDDIILEDAEKDKVKALFLQADLRKEDMKMKTKKGSRRQRYARRRWQSFYWRICCIPPAGGKVRKTALPCLHMPGN